MASYNRVILMGNLTRDPELKYLPSGTAVCDFGLAVNRRWRDKDGNQKEEVCFVDVTAFGRQAETINQYMAKGRPMLIEGRLKYDTWQGQDGSKRSKHGVVVENFTFVGPRDQGGAPADDTRPQGSWSSNQPPAPPPRRVPAPAPTVSAPPMDDVAPPTEPPTGENIPF